MKKLLIKIIAVIITGSVIGAVGFYFWKDNYVSQADIPIVTDSVSKEQDGKASMLQTENDIEKKKAEAAEAQIISYIEKNIDKIIGLRIDSAQKVTPVRIWFIDGANFYVDYKNSAAAFKRILVKQISEGNRFSYEVLGYFIPGDKGWVLESGKDIEGAVPVKLYEKNEETGEWIVK